MNFDGFMDRDKISNNDYRLIEVIADRAVESSRQYDVDINRRELIGEILAVHINICSLRLNEFLEADDFNFIHDIGGIRKYLVVNRKEGTIEFSNHFWPRFADEGR